MDDRSRPAVLIVTGKKNLDINDLTKIKKGIQ